MIMFFNFTSASGPTHGSSCGDPKVTIHSTEVRRTKATDAGKGSALCKKEPILTAKLALLWIKSVEIFRSILAGYSRMAC